MPKSPTQIPSNPWMEQVHTFGQPGAPAPSTAWPQPAGVTASSPGMPQQAAPVPYAPSSVIVAPSGSSSLIASWAAPTADSTHAAATSFNVRISPSGAGNWTTMAGANSPFIVTGLVAATAYDVQVQSVNAAGQSPWSPTTTQSTAVAGPFAPNAPAIASVVPPADGTTGKLTVIWATPTTDATHGAASSYNLRYAPTGTGSWTTVSAVTSPFTITGLSGAAGIDVQVQAANAAASPSAWSATTTGMTWGATVVPGLWLPSTTQTHNAAVAPNGGAQLVAVAAPTSVTGGAFAWSASNSVVPTSGLIAAGPDGQPNGFGQWFNAPATAGTYYLWLIAQGSGGATIGALATGPITVA